MPAVDSSREVVCTAFGGDHADEIGHPDAQKKIEDSLCRIVGAGRTAGTLCMIDNVQRFAKTSSCG